jgi:hypothetical protein
MQQKKLEQVRKHSIQRSRSRPAENEKVFNLSELILQSKRLLHAMPIYTGGA